MCSIAGGGGGRRRCREEHQTTVSGVTHIITNDDVGDEVASLKTNCISKN